MLYFERDRGTSAGRRCRSPRRFEAGVEGMEGRRMLTASGAAIVLAGSTVEVFGTDLGDTGMVTSRDGSVEIRLTNSQGYDDVLFPASQVSAIEFFGGSGKNTFTNATPLTGYLYGGSGDNVLTGGSGMDFLIATSTGTNVLNAGSGSEILEALGGGSNTRNGGSGSDTMISFAGNNHIVGGTGSSFIISFGGRNVIEGGHGSSTVYSFSSTDVIVPNDRETVIHIGY